MIYGYSITKMVVVGGWLGSRVPDQDNKQKYRRYSNDLQYSGIRSP
jgi:hypothetical protein